MLPPVVWKRTLVTPSYPTEKLTTDTRLRKYSWVPEALATL